MNFGEIQTAVKHNLGNRTDKDELIKIGINLGQLELCLTHPFSCYRTSKDMTLSSGERVLSFPTDLLHLENVILVNGTNSCLVAVRPALELLSKYPDPSELTDDEPQQCYLEGRTLQFYPAADDDKTIQLKYFKKPTSLSDDTDESELYGSSIALINYATYYVEASLNIATYTEYLTKFKMDAQLLITHDKRNFATKKFLTSSVGNGYVGDAYKKWTVKGIQDV